MTNRRPFLRMVLGVCCLVLAGSALLGCRKEEQGRVLLYEKGTYLGKADDKLDQEKVNTLRVRVSSQSGS